MPNAQSLRIPRQQAQNKRCTRRASSATPAFPAPQSPFPALNLLCASANRPTLSGTASGEGVFRIFRSPGHYELHVTAPITAHSSSPISRFNRRSRHPEISLVTTAAIEARSRLPRQPELARAFGFWRGIIRAPIGVPAIVSIPIPLTFLISPPKLFRPSPMSTTKFPIAGNSSSRIPSLRRHGEYLYTKPRWYDPFNRNKFKGDEPIWPKVLGQQTFLNLTATSETFFDGRRFLAQQRQHRRTRQLRFFGRGEQAFLDQTFRVSSTSSTATPLSSRWTGAFAFTPKLASTTQSSANSDRRPRPLGRRKSFRHARRLQEAFVEYKLHDLSPTMIRLHPRRHQEFNATFAASFSR